MKFNVKTSALETFTKAVIRSKELSLKEPGNIEMKLFIDENNPNVIYVYSLWKSQEAYTIHQAMAYTKELRAIVKASLQSAPEITKLQELQ